MASTTQIVLDGTISAATPQPGNGAGFGSGGAVRLVAPKASGVGVIETQNYLNNGGQGRIRIDAVDTSSMRLTTRGVTTIGANMIVFPPDLPELKIVEAAGQIIDPEALTQVMVQLPNGEPSTQTVKIEARNFKGTATVNVVLTPKYGERVVYPLDIANPGPGSAVASINVEFEPNALTRVDVWTR